MKSSNYQLSIYSSWSIWSHFKSCIFSGWSCGWRFSGVVFTPAFSHQINQTRQLNTYLAISMHQVVIFAEFYIKSLGFIFIHLHLNMYTLCKVFQATTKRFCSHLLLIYKSEYHANVCWRSTWWHKQRVHKVIENKDSIYQQCFRHVQKHWI